MQVVSTQATQERRCYTPDQSALWDRLSITQKFSAKSLTQFGYELAFIRHTNDGNLVVLLSNGNAATIDGEGDINTSPEISIR